MILHTSLVAIFSYCFGRSNIGIAGWNHAEGMDVCLRFSVFVLNCVEVEALLRADPSSKVSYQVSNRSQVKNPRQRKVEEDD
jgi:hypothetical protein